MPSFNAASVVEALDFTLKPYADVSGTITEPTGLQVQTYLNNSRKELERLRREVGNVGELEGDALLEALDKMDPDRTVAAQKRSAEILSALCSGKPTVAQLMKLPHRIMGEFAKWIVKEVLDPEAVTGAGNAQALSLVSSAAG